MTTYNFKYGGKDREVLVFEDSDQSIKGLDLNSLESSARAELMDLIQEHEKKMEKFTKMGFRNFLKEKLESEISRGRL
jgi:hypothetical protein